MALGQRESLLAALLLAVSYHHVFFSQNARGYSGLLFFSILGTAFRLRALTTDRTAYWVGYVLAMFLATATIRHAAFVLAGHGLVALVALWQLWRRGEPVVPLARKLLAVWAVLGLYGRRHALFCVAPVGPRGERSWAANGLPVAGSAAVPALSAWSLPGYYQTPKQPNRQSVRWVADHKGPGDEVVAGQRRRRRGDGLGESPGGPPPS